MDSEGQTISIPRVTPLSERLFWTTGWIYDFSKLATLILIVGLALHYFFVSVLVVRGHSMLPTYQTGQVLLVNKLSYLAGAPERGDVVAMFFPGEIEKRFVKRVVGLPGETVLIRDGYVFINGEQLAEPYLAVVTVPELERTLSAGEYFVMGDNRQSSSDSRAWGPVPESFIVGKAVRELKLPNFSFELAD
jgi:signal peptidase I